MIFPNGRLRRNDSDRTASNALESVTSTSTIQHRDPYAQPHPSLSIPAPLRAFLKDTRGFVLAEQLVSIIFIGLLCVAVAAGLTAAITAYQGITKQTEAQQLLVRAVDEVNGELAYARSSEGGQFISSTTNAVAQLASTDEGIVLKSMDSSAAAEVLVRSASGLTPAFVAEPAYDSDTNTWSYTVSIRDSGKVNVLQQKMSVVQINPSTVSSG